MKSKIAQAIHLSNHPVAVVQTNTPPPDAIQFQEGVWGCVVSMLSAASKGKTAALSEKTTACAGGKAGLGFQPFETGIIEYFLSVGGKGSRAGEYYKASPELALDYIHAMPEIPSLSYVVFQPLDELAADVTPVSVVFLVNADQLSALVTLANFDRPNQDNVQIKFGAGCAQAVLYSVHDANNASKTCTIGLTDPSARTRIDKELLSFSIPYLRFLEMEANVERSFLTKETWKQILKRI